MRTTEDPGEVLEEYGDFLASDPVRHNVVLTLLRTRLAFPQPGRYWVVHVAGRAAGVVLQSPLDFVATVTPMLPGAVRAAVDAIVGDGVALPGVNGEAATAAHFAGHWSERTGSAVRPWQGQRIYEVEEVVPPDVTPSGEPRRAGCDHRHVLVVWYRHFQAEIGESPRDVRPTVERRLLAGHLWMWWNGNEPVSLAGLSDPVAGVVRVGPVYTPPSRRSSGYASALVAAVSTAVRSRGLRCILYTDLANPTSNAIYRAIGYRAVAEALRYRFEPRL